MKIKRAQAGGWFIAFDDLVVVTEHEQRIFSEGARRGLVYGAICGAWLVAILWGLSWAVGRLVP